MALLTTQSITKSGLNPLATVSAAGGGDTIRCSDRTFLYVRNADASSKTVTLDVPGNTDYGQARPDVAVVIAAGNFAMIGPIDATFMQPGTNPPTANITYSAVTSVTVAAVQL
jgi:hypothetical protein